MRKQAKGIIHMQTNLVRPFNGLSIHDVPIVGGKNASLGEMIQQLSREGIAVPDGFATTADAFRLFLKHNNLDQRIKETLAQLDGSLTTLEHVGKTIRAMICEGEFPDDLKKSIEDAYSDLCKKYQSKNLSVAVRSSATAEDLPEASFAGQQESYLNIRGKEKLYAACRKCFASLFTNRAITYRVEKGFDHLEVALSVGVQKMVRSDKAGAGVIFTIDTETGFPNCIIITAAFGLGENVVQGTITPDEYIIFKPLLHDPSVHPIIEKTRGEKEQKLIYTIRGKEPVKNVKTPRKQRDQFVLSDDEILKLANWSHLIEKHYNKAMDIEWAKDGISGELFIVQARPETVQSQKLVSTFAQFELKERSKILIKGLAIGEAIATGKAQVIKSIDEIHRFQDGSILITEMTTPDWVPIMKMASGIITDHGGRTSHAAIMSRELNVPAIVGTERGTLLIPDGDEITLSCAEGDHGFVYEGILNYEKSEFDLSNLPKTKTQLMMNIATPAASWRWWKLPCRGIGLARMEFIIDNYIKIHPMALLQPEKVQGRRVQREINKLTRFYEDKGAYFVDLLADGIARIAASQYPERVIVRFSDFKTNEYANLIGGKAFEPHEDNPMLGFRGASRYYNERYRPAFELECAAIKKVRMEKGLKNVTVMIPFCRTLEEADRVIDVMKECGLERGKDDLEIYVMAEIPSNIVLAKEFCDRFDGFSIGSNDLTQLVLGVDRDCEDLATLFDERNPAITRMISQLIHVAHENGCKVGICGQGPSDYPDFAQFLVQQGIDSISLNPDSIIAVTTAIAEIEKNIEEK